MKKVMVYAYTAFNLGDDLFIKILCDRYPSTRFMLYAPREYKQHFGKIENLEIFPNNTFIIRFLDVLFRKIKGYSFFRKCIAKRCDAAVYIGGSLFMQNDRWRKGLKDVSSMRIEKKPFFLLGANFGPYQDKEFYVKYKELFKSYTDICFREKYSYEMFSDLDNVRIADDIIFQLKPKVHDVKYKNILISVIKPSNRKDLVEYDEIYYEKMKDIAIYFIEKGYKVTFMSFCESEGDKEAIETVMNLIPHTYLPEISEYLYRGDVDEALSVIAKSSFVIATRFHSMILGWLYNKPVFPIAYSNKMINVMEDVEFNGAYSELKEIHSLKPDKVFNSIEGNLIDVYNQVNNSKNHFQKIDDYLGKAK